MSEATLREALDAVVREYDPSEGCQNALTMHDIAAAALAASPEQRPAPPPEAVTWREYVRPEVARFAMLMENELRANDHKSHWRTMTLHALEARLLEEVDELSDARRWKESPRPGPMAGSYARALGAECADVANFAMMIADLAGALSENHQQTIALADAIDPNASWNRRRSAEDQT